MAWLRKTYSNCNEGRRPTKVSVTGYDLGATLFTVKFHFIFIDVCRIEINS